MSLYIHIYLRARRPLSHILSSAGHCGRMIRIPLPTRLRLAGPNKKIEITQSGAAYEKYGAKGLNDVCIAAISLILGGTDSSFACRCLSYPKRKLRIYHCPARSLFAFYEWPKGFENMYFRTHTKKKCDQ